MDVSMKWQDACVCWINTSSLTWTHSRHTYLSCRDTHCSPTCTHVELKRIYFSCKRKKTLNIRLSQTSFFHTAGFMALTAALALWVRVCGSLHTQNQCEIINKCPRAYCAWFITACYCKRKHICAFHHNVIAFLHF